MTLIIILLCITKGNSKDCEKLFALYCFPSVLKNGEKRKLWIKALKRENKDKTARLPGYSNRVCSIHFIDGIPTAANPVPTLHLGYEKEVPGDSCFASRSKRKEKQKNQQTLIDTTESCSNDEINIDCGCENTYYCHRTFVL